LRRGNLWVILEAIKADLPQRTLRNAEEGWNLGEGTVPIKAISAASRRGAEFAGENNNTI
jgi:hypothetical protein